MSSQNSSPIRGEVLRSLESGNFFLDVSSNRWPRIDGTWALLINDLVDIHNSRDFDIIDLFKEENFTSREEIDFFDVQHVYCEVLPALNAETSAVMAATSLMVRMGDDDLAAGRPNAAFRHWCEKASDRPHQALDIIKTESQTDFGLLSFVLEAGAKLDVDYFVQVALSFLQSEDPKLSLPSATALGRIDFNENTELVAKVANALVNELNLSEDDLLGANLLSALLGLSSKAFDVTGKIVEQVVSKIDGTDKPQTQLVAAHQLSTYSEALSDKIRKGLLRTLRSCKSHHTRIIQEIDLAISTNLSLIDREEIADTLCELISQRGNRIQLKQFKNTCHHLLTDRRNFLEWLLVRWLMQGTNQAREDIGTLLFEVGDEAKPFDIDLSEYGYSSKELVFLSRKVLGYLNLAPVSAASIICSAIRVAPKGTANELGNLLFNPLLINFPGGCAGYLRGIGKRKSDPAKKYAKSAIAELDNYLSELRTVGKIAELQPSNSNNRISMELQQQQAQEIHRAAMKESVLLSLVSKQTLLYGSGSVSYFQSTQDNHLHRDETIMSAHGVFYEYPRLDILDPVGLAHSTIQFRYERLNK